jgi:hypothetical protein
VRGNILYKIFYGAVLVYVGRTKQDLQQRIRGHFFKKPMHRLVDIFRTTRIEYAEFGTEADMFLYEVYFINKLKPPLNVDDRAHDDLSVELPPVEWMEFQLPLMGKWRAKMAEEGGHRRMYERNYGPILRIERTAQEAQQ